MDFTHANLLKNFSVFGGAVSFVLQKIVLRKLAVVHFHNPVPGNLRNN